MLNLLLTHQTNTHVKCHIQLKQRKRKQQNLPFKLEMLLKSALFCGFHNFNNWLLLIENRSDLHSFLFNGFEIDHRIISFRVFFFPLLSYQMTVCLNKLLHAFGPKLFFNQLKSIISQANQEFMPLSYSKPAKLSHVTAKKKTIECNFIEAFMMLIFLLLRKCLCF